MQIHFNGHHKDVNPALRTYTEEKLSKLLKHFDHITSIHVVYAIEKPVHLVEATIAINQAEIHARAESSDMYAAVDALEEKLKHQLSTYKGKHLERRRADNDPISEQD